MIDTFIMLIVVILLTVVSQYTYVKTILIIHFKYMQLKPQIYLKKAKAGRWGGGAGVGGGNSTMQQKNVQWGEERAI